MKKVLLINAPLENLEFGKTWKPTDVLTPPLGLMYLAHPLISHGFQVTFIDLNVERYEKAQFIKALKTADFILFYCYTFSMKNIFKIMEMIKKVNRKGSILCGGPYCNFSQKYVPGSDLTVVGEAEDVIVEILTRISSDLPLSSIPGLIYPQNGTITRNNGILQAIDINASRHATWNLTQEKAYGSFFGNRVKDITGMVCSRGCPYRCNFCTNKGIIPHRSRSPENVVAELKDLHKKGVKFVVFFDEHFLINKQWVNEILNRIILAKINLRYILQCRVDSVELRLFKKLRKAGVIGVIFGIENANQDVLDFYEKRIDLDMINNALKISSKLGFLTGGFFMLGSPLEDEEHFEINKNFLRKAPLDYLNVNILRYYEGTKLWKDALRRGILKKNETIVYANEKLSNLSYPEWLQLKDYLLKDFYSQPGRVSRLILKCTRFGLFPLVAKTLWYSKNIFFSKVANPFMPLDLKPEITV